VNCNIRLQKTAATANRLQIYIGPPKVLAEGKSFNQLVTSAGRGASRAIALLNSENMLIVFLDSPQIVTGLFSSIAEATGEYADAAFSLLTNPKMTVMLQKDPDGMVQRLGAIAASCGDSTPFVSDFWEKKD
jgi:hypothetical protein